MEHQESRFTIYSYFDFGLKNSSFRLPYQRSSSSADCARELFKGSKQPLTHQISDRLEC